MLVRTQVRVYQSTNTFLSRFVLKSVRSVSWGPSHLPCSTLSSTSFAMLVCPSTHPKPDTSLSRSVLYLGASHRPCSFAKADAGVCPSVCRSTGPFCVSPSHLLVFNLSSAFIYKRRCWCAQVLGPPKHQPILPFGLSLSRSILN
jgi:hypothetical protein